MPSKASTRFVLRSSISNRFILVDDARNAIIYGKDGNTMRGDTTWKYCERKRNCEYFRFLETFDSDRINRRQISLHQLIVAMYALDCPDSSFVS